MVHVAAAAPVCLWRGQAIAVSSCPLQSRLGGRGGCCGTSIPPWFLAYQRPSPHQSGLTVDLLADFRPTRCRSLTGTRPAKTDHVDKMTSNVDIDTSRRSPFRQTSIINSNVAKTEYGRLGRHSLTPLGTALDIGIPPLGMPPGQPLAPSRGFRLHLPDTAYAACCLTAVPRQVRRARRALPGGHKAQGGGKGGDPHKRGESTGIGPASHHLLPAGACLPSGPIPRRRSRLPGEDAEGCPAARGFVPENAVWGEHRRVHG